MRITYANVTSTLALFAALGGTGYAATQLTGKDIKDGSLAAADIKRSSLTGTQVKDGSLDTRDLNPDTRSVLKGITGSTGSAGATGPKGDSGPQGAKGDTGATGGKGDAVSRPVERWATFAG